MALSKNWSIVFPLKFRCPNAEKTQKNNDMKIVILNLNVFGLHIVANVLRLCFVAVGVEMRLQTDFREP